MDALDNLTREGFDVLQDVGYRNVIIDQLKISFQGIRYTEVIAAYTPPHSHNYFELHYIFEGTVQTTVNGIRRTYTPGQFYVMPPGSIHSHACLENPGHYLSFAIRYELQRIKSEAYNPELNNILLSMERSQGEILEDYCGSVAVEMNRIIELVKQGASRSEVLLRLAGLIVHAGNLCASYKGSNLHLPMMPQSSELIIRQAIRYIEIHSAEIITPADVAASIPISYSHLARLFAQYMDSSISNYIMRVKIDKAIHLLMSTDMDLCEIAQITGFSSASYFSHAFKQRTGLSPRMFRKGWKQGYFKGDYTVL